MQDKELDQHFLNSRTTLVLETNLANITENDTILEIGAGDGRLSEIILQKKPKQLISIEIDERYKDNLDKLKQKNSNFEFYLDNALEIIEIIKFNKIIANIPYNITEPLYKKILELKPEKIIFIHGITFYQHMISDESKWSKLISSTYEIELIKEIPGNAFIPEAKTISVLIELNLKNKFSKQNLFLQTIIKKQKRNCKNAVIFTLVDLLNISKKEAKDKIKNIEFSDKNFENLSNEEFITLINQIKLD